MVSIYTRGKARIAQLVINPATLILMEKQRDRKEAAADNKLHFTNPSTPILYIYYTKKPHPPTIKTEREAALLGIKVETFLFNLISTNTKYIRLLALHVTRLIIN